MNTKTVSGRVFLPRILGVKVILSPGATPPRFVPEIVTIPVGVYHNPPGRPGKSRICPVLFRRRSKDAPLPTVEIHGKFVKVLLASICRKIGKTAVTVNV